MFGFLAKALELRQRRVVRHGDGLQAKVVQCGRHRLSFLSSLFSLQTFHTKKVPKSTLSSNVVELKKSFLSCFQDLSLPLQSLRWILLLETNVTKIKDLPSEFCGKFPLGL